MVRHLLQLLGNPSQARLVFGLGAQVAAMDDCLAQQWTKEEWPRLEALEPAFEAFMTRLEAAEQLSILATEVNQMTFWVKPQP